MFKRWGAIAVALVLSTSAVWAVTSASANPAPVAGRQQGDQHRHRPARLHGDEVVIKGLAQATATVTRQRQAKVREQLKGGKSVEAIAQAAGASANDVLARFDTAVDKRMAKAVQSGRLPQSLADARAAWFKQAARLQIAQPGLSPAFPGLHELHAMVIGAAVEVSGLPRAEIRDQLKTCKTVTDIVTAKGKSGVDVANATMARVDTYLQANVANGKLAAAQRDAWRAALQTAATKMTTTPGLHVAGKQCAA